MTATIAYDKPVKNLIDELSATGHVTHRSFRKRSVTLHHNGGRLSHEGVLSVWKTRPASAHFDVDAFGRVAEYVKVLEYAWAVANTVGNQETISIEMCNATLSPHWEVGELTWREAARLAGWLFAHVIGERPTDRNLFYHHHWYQTSCAGPYMDSIYGQVLHAAQEAYDFFAHARPPAPRANKVELIQRALEVYVDGTWGPHTDARALMMRSVARARAGYPHDVAGPYNTQIVQRVIDTNPDGLWGSKSQAALVNWIKGVQYVLGVHVDGAWGPGTDGAFLTLRKNHLVR